MKRYTFYFFIALATFAIGSLIAINYFINSSKNEINQENSSKLKQPTTKLEFVPAESFSEKYINKSSTNSYRTKKEKPLCRDKTISQIWDLLGKDEYFRERSESLFKESNCVDVFEIFKFDLNRDGQKEIILRGKSSALCGGTGNCGFWIFEKKGKKYRKILSASDYVDITKMGDQIKKRRTNSYRDILLKGHWNASETTYGHYKFINGKYRLVKDLIDACFPCSGDDAKWKMITWKEYERLKLNN